MILGISKQRSTIIVAAVCATLLCGFAHAQTQTKFEGDIGATFGPVTDTCAFEFTLHDATAGGSQIGPVIERELLVRGGLYNVTLDFGPDSFEDGNGYLEVAAGCPAGTADLTTLTRRVFHPSFIAGSNLGDEGTPVTKSRGAPPKAALGTAFTYQGELLESGAPVTGSGDFQFSLWDALQGGSQIGATVPANGVGVIEGRFTTQLDFGAAAFDGDARWLEIAVDYPSGTGSFTALSPRQPLNAAPYAIQTRGIFVDDTGNVGIGTDTPNRPFHLDGSSTFEGDLHINTGHDLQFPDLTNRIYQDLGRLQLESSDGIRISPFYDLRVAGNTLVVNNTTDRVGIGTTTPTTSLDVAGDARFTGDVTVGSSLSDRLELVGHIQMTNGGWIGLGPFTESILFDDLHDAINVLGADFIIGATEADEMLHVENPMSSGRAFLKLQTSHSTDWGETGIRFETPQNRWHLRMDDDTNNNLPDGALGLRCNTPGHEIMTWTEDGTVGVGTTQPTAELDVVGDLEVSGAYRGHLGPNNGAPFPRPAYDSGWVTIAPGTQEALTHGIGGTVDNYVVNLQAKDLIVGGNLGVHTAFVGGMITHTGDFHGAFWKHLTSTDITIVRADDDIRCDEVRVQIWVVN